MGLWVLCSAAFLQGGASLIRSLRMIKLEPFGKEQDFIESRGGGNQQLLISPRYHAHSEIQRGDGLYGGLVVHNPNTVEHNLYGYDEELLFMVGDWYHKSSPEVLAAFMSITSEGLEVCLPNIIKCLHTVPRS